FKNIALVGATGNVGTFFLNSFKQAGSEFQVTLLTRKESESKALELVRGWPQFSVRAVDYSSESDLVDALQGQEVVLNITGSPGVRLQPAIIVAAEKAGVKWYIPSEFGGDLSKPENRSYPFYGGKFAVRDALEKSKLSYTYIANGSLADRFLTPFHGWDTKGRAVTVPGDGNTKASFTPCKDLASYTLAILRRYSQFKNTTARLASYTLSYNDWITAVQNATGNAYAVAHEPVEILRQRVAAN
ncbi:NAD(P)-binding protein, partial [Martensiomyces pterosporus]